MVRMLMMMLKWMFLGWCTPLYDVMRSQGWTKRRALIVTLVVAQVVVFVRDAWRFNRNISNVIHPYSSWR